MKNKSQNSGTLLSFQLCSTLNVHILQDNGKAFKYIWSLPLLLFFPRSLSTQLVNEEQSTLVEKFHLQLSWNLKYLTKQNLTAKSLVSGYSLFHKIQKIFQFIRKRWWHFINVYSLLTNASYESFKNLMSIYFTLMPFPCQQTHENTFIYWTSESQMETMAL